MHPDAIRLVNVDGSVIAGFGPMEKQLVLTLAVTGCDQFKKQETSQ
jgi:hypothetical protein